MSFEEVNLSASLAGKTIADWRMFVGRPEGFRGLAIMIEIHFMEGEPYVLEFEMTQEKVLKLLDLTLEEWKEMLK